MKPNCFILIVACLVAIVAGFKNNGENQPTFKSAMVTSSQDLYDLFENDPKTIFFVAFYIHGGKHESILESVETSLWSKKELFNQISYVPIDAKDDYQFHGILYDLGILYESHEEYPYFLIIKNMEGQIVKGPKSAEVIRKIILELTSKK